MKCSVMRERIESKKLKHGVVRPKSNVIVMKFNLSTPTPLRLTPDPIHSKNVNKGHTVNTVALTTCTVGHFIKVQT